MSDLAQNWHGERVAMNRSRGLIAHGNRSQREACDGTSQISVIGHVARNTLFVATMRACRPGATRNDVRTFATAAATSRAASESVMGPSEPMRTNALPTLSCAFTQWGGCRAK